jgi:hypothetical protein
VRDVAAAEGARAQLGDAVLAQVHRLQQGQRSKAGAWHCNLQKTVYLKKNINK